MSGLRERFLGIAVLVAALANILGCGGGGGGGSASPSCKITTPIGVNATVSGALASGDCTLNQLFPNEGFDKSLVDQYIVTLPVRGELTIRMSSAQIDSLLVLLNSPLELPEIAANDNEDSGTLNASITLVLDEGRYIILANSGGDDVVTGSYVLTTSFTPSIWTPTSLISAPEARSKHTAVWSGTEMMVWGGQGFAFATNTGARFNPVDNTWAAITLAGAPTARWGHTAVWTGTEMLVWGGTTGGPAFGVLGDGVRYNPQTNTWTPMSLVNAPSARTEHTAVWTGTEMIVWGGAACGEACSSQVNSGGRYNPATDTWTPISLADAPGRRTSHAAVWTGTEMIVWGGTAFDDIGQQQILGSGGIYDPVTDSWADTSLIGAPPPTFCHSAVWTGTEMIIFGGATNLNSGCGGGSNVSGGRLDPVTNSWTPMSDAPFVALSSSAPTIWTGNQLFSWASRAGARYNPANDSWDGISTAEAPPDRTNHTLVWTGSVMIVWGGNLSGDGGIYNPDADPTP